jgi:hypothetical protein
MSRLIDVAKGILIFFCGYYLFDASILAIQGQTALVALMLSSFSYCLLSQWPLI